MPVLSKESAARVINDLNRPIRIIERRTPEEPFVKLLRKYFSDIRFAEAHPNFGQIRISTIHPFAMLLFAEVEGKQLDFNVFPSITVADTADSESFEVLGKDFSQIMMGPAEVDMVKTGVNEGSIFLAPSEITRLEAIVSSLGSAATTVKSYHANHTIDLNVWAENKDLTSLIFDLLKHFVTIEFEQLHRTEGFDILQQNISGRRSGDINVEFGSLLYGANVTVPTTVYTRVLVTEPIEDIATINIIENFLLDGGS